MAELEYPIAIRALSEEDGGGYLAMAVDLRGCMADGETPEEAITAIRSAILEWIDEANRLGRKIPSPGDAVNRIRDERHRLQDILHKQDHVIAGQDRLIAHPSRARDALREEVEALREQLRELSRSEPYEEGSVDLDARNTVFASVATLRSRSDAAAR